jgi:hypothetical protein
MTNDELMTKPEAIAPYSPFEHSFVIRHSSFVILSKG